MVFQITQMTSRRKEWKAKWLTPVQLLEGLTLLNFHPQAKELRTQSQLTVDLLHVVTALIAHREPLTWDWPYFVTCGMWPWLGVAYYWARAILGPVPGPMWRVLARRRETSEKTGAELFVTEAWWCNAEWHRGRGTPAGELQRRIDNKHLI